MKVYYSKGHIKPNKDPYETALNYYKLLFLNKK
jgi:hypothetical protein